MLDNNFDEIVNIIEGEIYEGFYFHNWNEWCWKDNIS